MELKKPVANEKPFDPVQIGHVMYAARKSRGLPQAEVATHLKISQGYLSRLENGLNIPDAIMWFSFCDLLNIPYESLKTGFIDFLTPAKSRNDLLENGFKLPRHYAEARGLKVRSLLPILAFLRRKQGEQKSRKLLQGLGIKPEFFVSLDNQIHLDFYLDLISRTLELGLVKPKQLELLSAGAARPEFHGNLGQQYLRARTGFDVLQIFADNGRLYDCDFQYGVTERTEQFLELTVTPLTRPESPRKELAGGTFCEVRSQYLRHLASLREAGDLHVVESSCAYAKGTECVFHFSKRASA